MADHIPLYHPILGSLLSSRQAWASSRLGKTPPRKTPVASVWSCRMTVWMAA